MGGWPADSSSCRRPPGQEPGTGAPYISPSTIRRSGPDTSPSSRSRNRSASALPALGQPGAGGAMHYATTLKRRSRAPPRTPAAPAMMNGRRSRCRRAASIDAERGANSDRRSPRGLSLRSTSSAGGLASPNPPKKANNKQVRPIAMRPAATGATAAILPVASQKSTQSGEPGQPDEMITSTARRSSRVVRHVSSRLSDASPRDRILRGIPVRPPDSGPG